jgi:hypothetical protein
LAKVFQSKDTAFFYFFYAEKPSDWLRLRFS